MVARISIQLKQFKKNIFSENWGENFDRKYSRLCYCKQRFNRSTSTGHLQVSVAERGIPDGIFLKILIQSKLREDS